MEEIAEKASKTVEITEKDLLTTVALKETTYKGLESQLDEFRRACQNYIFLDFQAAARRKTEGRLWEAHLKVNRKLRSLLARFRDDEGKKKHVERRKAEKLYLDFIKSSMRFYRTYIQRLASHFKDVPEVFDIAHRFNLDTLSADQRVTPDLELKQLILHSCHVTLIRLGDLSRYRETELRVKDRNWGPAKGYYDLAAALDPSSGLSYNQQAVIALADQDHLRAMYYLYRALCVQNPAPTASDNLNLEFKKILTRQKRGEVLIDGGVEIPAAELQTLFLQFHAQRYEKRPFAGSGEKQGEILRQLADELKERPFDTTIRKMCLTNIAAEHCVAQIVTDESSGPDHLRALIALQQFNVATFFILLKLLLDELQQVTKETDDKTDRLASSVKRVTPVTRRILPHLRIYSAWLISKIYLLVPQDTGSQDVHLHALWQAYAEAMSLLTASFPTRELPDIPYLLDEDQDTVSFTPFSEELKKLRFRHKNGLPKPVFSNTGVMARIPDEEMLYRIKDLVREAVYLCKYRETDKPGAQQIPLVFAGNCFVFQDDEDDHLIKKSNARNLHTHTVSTNSISREDIDNAKRSRANKDRSETGVTGSATSRMEHMVNDLVQSEASEMDMSEGPPTPTLKTPVMPGFPNQISQAQPGTVGAHNLIRQASGSPNGVAHLPSAVPTTGHQPMQRPSLPSVWNTPFAPRPGETPGSSPRPSTSHRVPLSTAPQSRSSGALFQEQIAQRQQDIQMRSSPPQSLQPTLSSCYDTPTGFTSMLRAHDHLLPQSSPWQSSPPAAVNAAMEVPRKLPQATLFGAIGEARPMSSRTPTSGQPG